MGNQIGYVCIMSELEKEKEVVEATKAIREVEGAWVVYGNYDIIAKVTARDLKALNNIVQNQIRQIPNVRATLTFPVVESELSSSFKAIP
ncbi:hypothetical protein AMJ50_00215 [Parcubacteria bacterium DG_74_3]|nr:MAG: hypothetical protein AMJ50_00215 [Parcubacteria bacterium DG_74_3]